MLFLLYDLGYGKGLGLRAHGCIVLNLNVSAIMHLYLSCGLGAFNK